MMMIISTPGVEEIAFPLDQQPGVRYVNDLPFSVSAYYAAVACKLCQNIPSPSNLANEANLIYHGEQADTSSDTTITLPLNDIPPSSNSFNDANSKQTDTENCMDNDEP
eukprot:7667493-Ditylum_brightwellii.AAC.1